MKKEKMINTESNNSFQAQKLDLIRLRIKNGYYKNQHILENVVKEILEKEIKKK
jgi:hypothetical protein